jgi:hypothetical protein
MDEISDFPEEMRNTYKILLHNVKGIGKSKGF